MSRDVNTEMEFKNVDDRDDILDYLDYREDFFKIDGPGECGENGIDFSGPWGHTEEAVKKLFSYIANKARSSEFEFETTVTGDGVGGSVEEYSGKYADGKLTVNSVICGIESIFTAEIPYEDVCKIFGISKEEYSEDKWNTCYKYMSEMGYFFDEYNFDFDYEEFCDTNGLDPDEYLEEFEKNIKPIIDLLEDDRIRSHCIFLTRNGKWSYDYKKLYDESTVCVINIDEVNFEDEDEDYDDNDFDDEDEE